MSPALQEVYSMLWSETVFLIQILLFIVSLNNYLRLNNNKWLLISTGICAITCLTRYAGFFMVFTGVTLIFFNEGNGWRRQIIHSLIFGSLSISLLFINIIRNLRLTGLATGVRPPSEAGIMKIMEYFGAVLCDWLQIGRKPGSAIFLAFAVCLLFAGILIFNRFKKNQYGLEYVIATTGLVYSAFMIFTYSVIRYEPFTNRLLAPIFIPLLWSMSSWIPGMISSQPVRIKWLAGIPALLVATWFLNKELRADWEYYDGVKDAGIPGYREDPFVQSRIVQFLKNDHSWQDDRNKVFSNAGDAFYYVTGKPAFQLPFIDYPQKVQQYYASKNEYLVWFQNEENLQMPDLNSILKNKNMFLVKQLPDGAVYVTKQ
jgi:hypothetical protein